MQVIVVRHGKAERDSHSGHDEDRALRTRGEAQAAYLGEYFKSLQPQPDLIVSSGFTRAINTARILQRTLGVSLHVQPVLEVGHATSEVLGMLAQTAERHRPECVVLVGHNPQLEHLVGVMVHGVAGSPGLVTMRTGEAAILDQKPGAGELAGGFTLAGQVRLQGDDED